LANNFLLNFHFTIFFLKIAIKFYNILLHFFGKIKINFIILY